MPSAETPSPSISTTPVPCGDNLRLALPDAVIILLPFTSKLPDNCGVLSRLIANAVVETEYYGPLDLDLEGKGVLLDAQFTGIIPTASSIGVNGIVTDLSLVGSLTGGQVETRHILFVDPISSAAVSLLGMIF